MDELAQRWPDQDRRDDALLRLLLRTATQAERWCLPNPRVPRDALNETERRALEAMSRGLTMTEAAVVLGVPLELLKSRLKMARRVLAAKNTTHACCEALRQGLIT